MSAVFENGVLTLSLQTTSLSEMIELRRVSAKHGASVHDLHISMGVIGGNRAWFTRPPGLKFVDYQPIDWGALFLRLPVLRSLVLTETPLSSPHVRLTVEAAGERCTALESLVLPVMCDKHDIQDEVEAMLQALYAAMKKWNKQEANPGLLQLTVPCGDDICSRAQLIERIVSSCPNLTQLSIELYHLHNNAPDPSSASEQDRLRLADGIFGEDGIKWSPRMRCFTVRDVGSFVGSIDRIRTITDRSLVALSQLSSLSDVYIRGGSVTGDGLFEFLNGISCDSNITRTFEIKHYCNETTLDMKFLHTFLGLMGRIVKCDPAKLRFANAAFVLKMRNVKLWYNAARIRPEDLDKAKALVDRVKTRHPSLRVRVTMGKRGGLYARNFMLYTDRSELEPGNDWNLDEPGGDNWFVVHSV